MIGMHIVSYNISSSPNLEQVYDMLDKAFDKCDNLDGLIILTGIGNTHTSDSGKGLKSII